MFTNIARRGIKVVSQQARQCSNIAAEMRRVPTYHPDYIDKSILVHYKHYPNVAAVPDRVDQHIMDRVNKISIFQKYLLTTYVQAKSMARVKFANIMIVGTLIGCAFTVYVAKSNSRQNSLVQENQRRHLMYTKGDTGSGVGRIGLVTRNQDDA